MPNAPLPIRVLVVDDESVRGMLFQRIVEEQPDMHHLATIDNEDLLLAFLKDVQPDVMIISVLLGHRGQNCIRLTKQANDTYPNMPIIWYGGPDDWVPLAQACNVYAFMPKPVNLKAIVSLIQEAHNDAYN